MSQLDAPDLVLQPVSVTRKMAASLPGLRALAQAKGLKMHHLGAGYPHPEVTDPRQFIAHEREYRKSDLSQLSIAPSCLAKNLV